MSDTLTRFVFEHAPVRGAIVRLAATWRAVLERHEYPPALRALLGESMAAAALLASTLKFDGSMIMQMYGSGPVKLLVVECDSEGHLRATAKWDGTPSGGSVAQLLGDGRFVISIAPREGQQTYQAVVALEGEHIADVLRHYLLNSEQIDSWLWLAADTAQAAGMLLQKLPERASGDADAWPRVTQLGATVRTHELLELSAPQIVRRLFHQEDVRMFDALPMAFRCSCSRARVSAMLRMLGRDEVDALLRERDKVEVRCEFCNRCFVFDRVDADHLFVAESDSQPGTTRH